jgi:hypothetical protein
MESFKIDLNNPLKHVTNQILLNKENKLKSLNNFINSIHQKSKPQLKKFLNQEIKRIEIENPASKPIDLLNTVLDIFNQFKNELEKTSINSSKKYDLSLLNYQNLITNQITTQLKLEKIKNDNLYYKKFSNFNINDEISKIEKDYSIIKKKNPSILYSDYIDEKIIEFENTLKYKPFDEKNNAFKTIKITLKTLLRELKTLKTQSLENDKEIESYTDFLGINLNSTEIVAFFMILKDNNIINKQTTDYQLSKWIENHTRYTLVNKPKNVKGFVSNIRGNNKNIDTATESVMQKLEKIVKAYNNDQYSIIEYKN